MQESTHRTASMFEDRLILDGEGGAHLRGISCSGCGRVVFPRSESCPGCGGDDVAEVELGARGEVWTYTVVYVSYGSVGLEPPYVTAMVRLEEGAFVHALLVGCDPEEVHVGMAVRLKLLRTGEEGRDRVVYAFGPSPDAGERGER